MNNYTLSLDKLSRNITLAVACLGAIILIAGLFAYVKSGKEIMVLFGALLGPFIIGVLIIAMYLLMPRSVQTGSTGITILRKISPVVIPFADLKSIRMAETEEMKGVIRTFGNGGLFGYTGLYYNKKLGSMTWYCTQRKNYIIIDKKDNKRIVITPDQPEEFIRDIRQFISDTDGK